MYTAYIMNYTPYGRDLMISQDLTYTHILNRGPRTLYSSLDRKDNPEKIKKRLSKKKGTSLSVEIIGYRGPESTGLNLYP